MCPVCNGAPGCPVCAEEPKEIKCENCNGDGVIYVLSELGEVPYSIWKDFPDDEKWEEPCEVCKGEGKVYLDR